MTIEREQLNDLIGSVVDAEVEARYTAIVNENADLKTQSEGLRERIESLEKTNKILKSTSLSADTLLEVFELFNVKMMAIQEAPLRGDLVYKLLDVLFVKDFDENTYDCPIWLGAVTNYYSNKDLVIDLLEVLKIDMPENIREFRLPHEWTEDELNIVFATMSKHIVCNGRTFEDNLCYWKHNALKSVYDVCNSGTYTEIPWQFLLRNPNLLQDKFLSKIGKMAWEQPFCSGWRYFFHIQDYQKLTPQQLKTLIGNINPFHKISKDDFQ